MNALRKQDHCPLRAVLLTCDGHECSRYPLQLPSADEIEYWKSPDKVGYLQSQGDVIKSWRNRWFVLKQGYLFRFYNDKVSESNKPRGVVDISKVQDVKVSQRSALHGVPTRGPDCSAACSSAAEPAHGCPPARERARWPPQVLPGRSNTIQLKTTSGGVVCYIANSETEVVEWVSAIESAMAKIHKHVAGAPGTQERCWTCHSCGP